MTPRNRVLLFLSCAAIALNGCAAAPGGASGAKPAAVGQAPVAGAALAAGTAPAAAADAPPPPSVYGAWEPWIGGVWVAQLPPDDDGTPRHMELSYTWGDNRASVRCEVSVFKGETQSGRVTGLISWNGADQDFRFQGSSSDGDVEVGALRHEAGAWVCEVNRTARNGAVSRERILTRLVSADVASCQRFQLRGGFFTRILDLRVERRWPNI